MMRSDPPHRARRWQAGFLAGAVLGAVVTIVGRRAERSAREGGLIDWPAVERVALQRLSRAPGRLGAAELAASEADWAATMDRVVPRLTEALGTELPGVVGRASVVDRAGWVRANAASVAMLFERIERRLIDQVVPSGAGLPQAGVALLQRWVTTRQIGLMLGFMASRVLGQYDLALLSPDPIAGRLMFVEENIRQTARVLGVPLAPFRTWIAIHEATHAFEFEAHPWLKPYLADRLERQLDAFSGEARELAPDMTRRLGRWLRGEGGGGHWLERLMNPEQLRLFRETQALMSLLEGFSDFIMDEVGRDLVPDVERLSARFRDRRRRRKGGIERAMMRLTGMDMKLEQYEKGERFVAAISAASGPAAFVRLWSGPESLPTAEEIEVPSRWLARMAA